MGKLNVNVHPLFFIFGLYFALTGKVFSFIVITLTAVLHEFGHAIQAEKLGYKLFKITLMPYGAVISGDINGIKYSDEVKVVLAGPLVNLCIAVAIMAVWWIFPSSYPYTQAALYANASIFLVNLIPAFPLDGGRLLLATLSLKLKRKTAVKVAKFSGYVLSLALLFAFALTAFTELNLSLLFFSLFILFGSFDLKNENEYVRIYESYSPSNIKNFKEVKTLAITSDFTVKRLLAALDGDCLYRLYVYYPNGKYKVLEPYDVGKLLEAKSLYEKIISNNA